MEDPQQWFAGLYDSYYRNVVRYALQHAEQGTAEDVASEAFLIAWRKVPNVPEPPLPWLLGVARNLLRKQSGATRRRLMLAERLAVLTGPADVFALGAGEQVVERTAALDALASLPRRDIEALTLVSWHGLDPAGAAAVVGCSTRAFTVRLHRARRRLAKALQGEDQALEESAPRPVAGVALQATPLRLPSPSTTRR